MVSNLGLYLHLLSQESCLAKKEVMSLRYECPPDIRSSSGVLLQL